ncbi:MULTISPECIES: TlpA disulfide reductase family protein [unclassified Pseudoxanthomonas]|uniref:TlpA disulfide reductase family protein n=1 Tax=unclassified Pseudoxanthomonas TaxID=2645906 RepID=UPI0008EF7A0A|nr:MULTISPECIES: TlpA disulfide reductase family protein [unclassified Pseudoxanthomonas]PPJ43957.1 TlpA family protein disulfide reductase [Pseudoxanthomonas sp. KAs_5_3]SFV25938.1 Thiol-disulfide isomerase or thioredoxin [Pseudoxanthomonas sp. YR558]
MMRSLWLAVLLAVTTWAHAAEPVKQPGIGETPPPIGLKDREGNAIDLAALRGKVVVVTFWASWCGPCRRELPMLGRVQEIVGREHLEVIAVNFKEPRRDFNAVIRANKNLKVTYVLDERGVVSDRYGVTALPNMFIIGQDGLIAQTHRGYSDDVLQSFTQELLDLLPEEALQRKVEQSPAQG